MISTICALTLTGSIIVLFWRSLYPLLKNRFGSVWHYAILKTALLFMVLPVALVLSNAEFISQAATELKASMQSAEVRASGDDTQLPVLADAETLSTTEDTTQSGNAKQSAALNWLIPTIWAAGVLFSIGCKFCKYNCFRRKVLRKSTPCGSSYILEILENCKKETGMKSTVTLMTNPLVQTPMVTGIFNPTIILPEKQFTADDARCIFLHELTHIRTGDLWFRLLALIAAAIHWFNPIAHFLNKRVIEFGELHCDELVVKSMSKRERKMYGETIINLISEMALPPKELIIPLSEKRGIKRRLFLMLNTKNMSKAGKIISVAIAIAIICSAATITAFALAVNSNDTQPELATADDKSNSQENARPTENNIFTFEVNENGHTYGAVTSESNEHPDLILAEGVNGTVGYVLRSDVYDGTGPLAKPQTPEETVLYMEQLRELAREAINKGEEYVYYIPLYDKDGETVIGKVGVSIPTSLREELGAGLPGDEG